MDELLNLMKVKLCNCTINDEEIIKIKEYIENGGKSLNLDEVHKYNMENAFRSHYSIREEFWKLMDSFMDKEEVFKRLLNVFFAIGEESFFKIVDSRFYSVTKSANYLKSIDNKERLLIWLIKNCYHFAKETIEVLEEIINLDKKAVAKAFEIAKDNWIKLALAILAVSNSCELSENAEEFIKQNLKTKEDINKLLKDKQIILLKFLYYAHNQSEELKQIISDMVNNSTNNRIMFDELVKAVLAEHPEIKTYDITEKFNIDKRLYVLRLINLYVTGEKKNILQEITEKIKDIPSVFEESLEFIKKNRHAKNNLVEVEKIELAFLIYNYSKKDEDFEEFKKQVKNILGGFISISKASGETTLVEQHKALSEKNRILEYVMEGSNEENIKEYIDIVENTVANGYYEWRYDGVCFNLIYSVDKTREAVYRFLYLVLNAEKYRSAASIIYGILGRQSMSYTAFAKELLAEGINEKHLIFSADAALNEKAKEYLINLCREENKELINNIDVLSIDSKKIVFENLFEVDKEKYSEILVKGLCDDSKSIRDMIGALLGSYEDCKEKVLGILKSKKTAVREAAVRVLMNFDMRNFKAELEGFAEKEKNEKIKVLILNIINADYLDEEILASANNINNYCAERLKKTTYAAPEWIAVNGLPDVKHQDGSVLSKDAIVYLMSKYSLENVVERNLTAEKVIEKCNKQDLDVLGVEIFNLWVNNGADTKEKWILSLISAVGGFKVVNSLKTQIDLWSKSSRGAIACDAIKALALSGSDESLIIIDNIARKFKHKQIKKAAAEAFIAAAKILNLTEEDLADRIIPDLGFDIRGERIFDYGSRSFRVTLEMDFSLKITDSNGKVIKTLPKPNKSDDELKAKEASEEFKTLKKQIKTIISTQSLRLEMALSANRLWKKKQWEKLFVRNPIMHNFSLGLVWGVYDKGKLKDTFRYMEDGTFNTKDEEEYMLMENALIGLVHPLEMDTETLEGWQQQFEDYEIVQPFAQLQRKIYKVTEEEKEMKNIERFAGIKINGLSLVGKLTKAGWYRGSVQDAGCYYEFYKEDEKIGIGAELQFSYLGVGYEDEETTIYELVFYKANTVERGSYVYDEVTEENIILPVKVPERFFSEILYDVDKALEAKTGFVDNWKLNR